MDTAKKPKKNQGTNFAKAAGKKIVKKSTKATGDLIGNKIADKIISLGNKTNETNELEEIIIPPEKRQQIIDVLGIV